MKKARFKTVLFGLIAVFALFLLGLEKGQAQTEMQSLKVHPAGASTNKLILDYVSSAEALEILDVQCAGIKEFLITLTPGTQAWHLAEATQFFYEGIRMRINSGETVQASITGAMTLFADPGFADIPLSEQMSLLEEATDLLSD